MISLFNLVKKVGIMIQKSNIKHTAINRINKLRANKFGKYGYYQV